jgi:hypothetical protein
VHCDVKPSNVLLDQDEHVYVADLGLSRRLEDQRPGDESSMGTPAYLAPEHIEGLPIDGRADVYSLGCLLYECLTGELPFTGDSRLALAWAHLEEDPPRASERNPKLPGGIDVVLAKALAKEPAQRYSSCAALLDDAQRALGLGRPGGARLRWRLLLAAVLVALAAAAVVAFVVARNGRSAPPIPRLNTLVRIDPKTYRVTDVIPVQFLPYATEFGGGVVWVYNHASGTLSEVDAAAAVVRRTVPLRTISQVVLPYGPSLAADDDGAWIVGSDVSSGRGFATNVQRDGGRTQVYPLPVDPTAVALGEGAVWVVGSTSGRYQLLRIDENTGHVTGRRTFRRKVESLTAGLGSVWVLASLPGLLYQLDPRSLRITGVADVGRHAVRPAVIDGQIWIGIEAAGGQTAIVDAETLGVGSLNCCLPSEGSDAEGFGSDWMTSWPTGTVVRWDLATKDIARSIQLVDAPRWGGLCLASIATGAGAVWVSVAPTSGDSCPSLG